MHVDPYIILGSGIVRLLVGMAIAGGETPMASRC
jgi:hypothetical protein